MADGSRESGPLPAAAADRPPGGGLLRQAADVLGLLPQGGPSICNFALTNVCNATCDFCGYARDKSMIGARKWADTARAHDAIAILHRRGIRYLTFTGGEPTLHRGLPELIAGAVALGMRASVVTNGYTLHRQTIDALDRVGLRTLFISIDAPDAATHEANRGLKGGAERIRTANRRLAERGIKTVASVTINRLIDDFDRLIDFLRALGFTTVTFSYPKTALHSSSLVFSRTSSLVDYSVEELIAAFRAVQTVKTGFPVLNPAASLAEMIRHLKGEPEVFPCFGGYKYFYLDYHFNLYRCDFWAEPMGTIEDFATLPFVRDGCTRCMSDCYRDASVFLHFPVALGDALGHLRAGRVAAAFRVLATASNRRSIGALIGEWRTLRKLSRTGSGAVAR
ncbi:MAG: radical SAM protein [Azospirillum sp.]|nr:radical SAM protein [Azospirillum sp.]